MQFRILGPLEVQRGQSMLDLGAAKQKALLSILLIHANEVVSTERLMDLLWDDDPPKTAAKVLQVYVSGLRKVIEPPNGKEPKVLVTTPPGYTLRLEPDQLDLHRFERLVGDAHRALEDDAHERAASLLREALDLWRGEPLSEFGHEHFAIVEKARLEELRLTAIEDRVEIDLIQGSHQDVAAELEGLVADFPLRERLAGQAIVALYRSGRHADALQVFRRVRDVYVEELGIEPGPALQDLQRKILIQDESLQWSPQVSTETRTNIPEPTTSFVGRNQEMDKVRDLLSGSRLVTLTGPGGCGKSRLALEVASGSVSDLEHGVWLIELASITRDEHVTQVVVSALGLKEELGQDPLDTLIGALRTKELLLVLDNCEHVIEGAATVVHRLLRTCNGVRILATSREPLVIDGEVSWMVPPLSMPSDEEAERPWDGSEAVRLFVERASAAQPGFVLSDDNLGSVIQICDRLDGMPLAIELAAPRVRTMSLDQIAARLDDALGLLTVGKRTAAPRHRTLRGAIDWSYALLSEHERSVLARLSVFAGGFTLSAAEVVCHAEEWSGGDFLGTLTGLVEKSLVAVEDHAGQGRYRLLETIREYASEKLKATGDAETRDRHATYFLDLIEGAEAGLRGPRQRYLLERLESEHQNLRQALRHLGGQGRVDDELRLAAASWRYCYLRGRYVEGRQWLDTALSKEGGSASARARASTGAGALSFYRCEYAVAEDHFHEGSDLFRQIEDPLGLANTLTFLGAIAREQADYPRALDTHSEALSIFEGSGDRWGVAHSLQMSGLAAWLSGSYEDAQEMSRGSLQMFRELRDDERTAWALMDLGAVAHYLGDRDRAINLIRRSLSLFDGLDFKEGIAWSLNLLGLVELTQGDIQRARSMLSKSLTLHQQLGDRWRLGSVLEILGAASQALGEAKVAARTLGAADALRRSIGTPVPTCERRMYDATVAQLRLDLGPEAFSDEWEAGRLLAVEEACEQARR